MIKNIRNGRATIMIAALALGSVALGKMAIISGFGDFSKEFSTVSLSIKQLLISVSSLSAIPVAFFMLGAGNRINDRKLAILAGLMFAVGGIYPVFSSNFVAIFISRFIMGIGMAMGSTLAGSLIMKYFEGEARNRLIGYNSAIKSLFGVIFSYFGGVLATRSWRSSYWLYSLGFFVALISFLLLPEDNATLCENDNKEWKQERESNKREKRVRLPFHTWHYSISSAVMFVFFSVYGNNLSILFAEQNIGSSVQSGTASAIMTVGGLIAGLLFYRVFRIFKKFTHIIGYIAAGISILFMGMTASFSLFCVMSLIFGVAFYTVIPHQMLLAAYQLQGREYTSANALYNCGVNIGQLISPFILNSMTQIVLGDAIHAKYIVAGTGLLLMGAVGSIENLLARK